MGLGITIEINGQAESDLSSALLVEVEEKMGQLSRFKLSYAADVLEGDIPIISDSRLDPGVIVTILAESEQGKQCLIKGPVTAQRINLNHGSDGSVLEVMGQDSSIQLDREAKTTAWASVSDSDVVTSILQAYGYLPDVERTSGTHVEAKHVLMQRQSDYQFVKMLANKNGFHFWLSCDSAGIETAHFRRPKLGASPENELAINLDTPMLDQLMIEWNVEQPTSIQSRQLDLNQKTDINADQTQSPLDLLAASDLATVTGGVLKQQYLTAPSDDVAGLSARTESALIDSNWFIRAACQTNAQVLKGIVRANTVLTLRGAGSRHSGNYYVSAVKHVIDESAHTMDIELARNAWG